MANPPDIIHYQLLGIESEITLLKTISKTRRLTKAERRRLQFLKSALYD